MATINQGVIAVERGRTEKDQGFILEYQHGYTPSAGVRYTQGIFTIQTAPTEGAIIVDLDPNNINPRAFVTSYGTGQITIMASAIFIFPNATFTTFYQQIVIDIVANTAVIVKTTLVEAQVNPCDNIGVQLEAFEADGVTPTNLKSIIIDNGTPIIVNPATQSYILDFPRESDRKILQVSADTPALGFTILYPDIFVAFMKTDITYTLTFSTITVEQGVGFEYDFGEGGGWVLENSHVYASSGQYTLSVRDAYGCIKTVQIVATELPVVDLDDFRSHFYVSKANPLRFFKVENKANCTVYGKDENSSGCDDIYTDIPYVDTQMVRSCLTVNNQFRSGFDNHLIEVFDEEDVLVSTIFPTLVEENLRIVDRRSYDTVEDDIFTYIFFPDSFKIPYLFIPGLEVSIGGETHRIIDKKYVEDINRWAIVTEKFAAYNSTILETTYNRALYNTYEFSLNGFANGTYRVKITATRTTATNPADNITVVYSSLWFEVADSFEDTVDILYKNYKNNDIYWVGGFTGTITVGIQSRVAIGEIELSVVGTDDDSYLDEAYGREQFRFLFEPLTLEMARKLMVALSQSEVLIDDQRYVFSNVSIATIGERTNDYTITAEGYKNMERIEFANTFGCALGGGGGGSTIAGKQVRYDRIDDLVGNWSVLIPKGYSLHAIWVSNSDTATADANVLCGLTAGSDEIIDAIQGKIKFADYKVADNTWKIFSRHTIFNPAADVRINFEVSGIGASASIIVQYLAIAD